MTIGEIIYSEYLATERDQIYWATAAQAPELLPRKEKKRTSKKNVVKAVLSSYFMEEIKELERRKKAKNE